MIGQEINNGFIDFAKVDFECPICKTKYNDYDDKYINRCNKNKSGVTRIKCSCNNSFYMTYDYTGEAVSFLLDKHKLTI